VDGLAGGEVEGLPRDPHGLGAFADQVHLDAAQGPVVEGSVRPGGEVEVGAELPVDAGQQVAIEGGGDPRRIVVGGIE
jgi:hypothetical protein